MLECDKPIFHIITTSSKDAYLVQALPFCRLRIQIAFLFSGTVGFFPRFLNAIEWWQWLEFLSEHPCSEMPNCIPDLITCMLSCRNGEDLIQLFERESFCLWNIKQNEEPQDHTPRRIPTKSTLRFERAQQEWPSERKNEIEALQDISKSVPA